MASAVPITALVLRDAVTEHVFPKFWRKFRYHVSYRASDATQ